MAEKNVNIRITKNALIDGVPHGPDFDVQEAVVPTSRANELVRIGRAEILEAKPQAAAKKFVAPSDEGDDTDEGGLSTTTGAAVVRTSGSIRRG